MVRAAREVTVIADSSKLGQRSLACITSLDHVHRIITDIGAPDAIVGKFRSAGIEVQAV
jgi:DeoR/GlpR family transcriptional regulator of sugar metabolism